MTELVTEIVSGESYQYYPLGKYVCGLSVFVESDPLSNIPGLKPPVPLNAWLPAKPLMKSLKVIKIGCHVRRLLKR